MNVGSISGDRGDAGNSFYGAAKAAGNNLTQALALEFGGIGVRFNTVSLGLTRTPLTEMMWQPGNGFSKLGPAGSQNIPRHREGTPDEIASVILFLSHSDASFVNGVILPVDGGVSASCGQPRSNV